MEFESILPTAVDLNYYSSIFLCVRCIDVSERDPHGWPTELSGPEITTLVYIPYHSAYDGLHEEFWHELSGGWWLPICKDCADHWSKGANFHGDPQIGFILEFVTQVCLNYPIDSESALRGLRGR